MHTILNLSGVYNDEGWFPPGAAVMDFLGLEGCYCYCSSEALAVLRRALDNITVSGIHWIDTGDFHYLSKLWLEKIDEPFALALFDNHPDDEDDTLGSGLLSCGNWVKTARKDVHAMKADFRNTGSLPPGLPVYLSIDLDVLAPEWARTCWSQGDMTAAQLIGHLESIRSNHRILGVDICGGMTVAQGAGPADLAVNVRTRNMLLAYFDSHPLVSG